MKNRKMALWVLVIVLICAVILAFFVFRFSGKTAKDARFWGSEQMVLGKDEANDSQLFYGVSDVFSDKDGNLYVVEEGNQRVQVFDTKGIYLRTIGAEGQGPGEFTAPIAGGCFGDNVYIADEKTQKILVFNRKDGTFRYGFKLDGRPSDLCVNQSGDLFIAYMTSNGKIIHQYNADGVCAASFGELDDKYKALIYFNKICSLTLDDEGNLYVCYHYINLVQEYNSKGELIREAKTRFRFPDSAGIHGTAKSGFQARTMFWSSYFHKGSLYFVTAPDGPIAKILKSDNYTVVFSKDLQEQTIVRNPFPVLCGAVTSDGRLVLCDMDYVVHVFRK